MRQREEVLSSGEKKKDPCGTRGKGETAFLLFADGKKSDSVSTKCKRGRGGPTSGKKEKGLSAAFEK